MNNRKLAACLLAILGLGVAAPTLAAAEPRPSHRPIGPGDNSSEDRLTERLQTSQQMLALRGFVDQVRKEPDKFNFSDKVKQKLLQQYLKSGDLQKLLQDKELAKELLKATTNTKLDADAA